MFNDQLEGVNASALCDDFYSGLFSSTASCLASNLIADLGGPQYGEAYMNSEAYSAQGMEGELAFQPRSHFLLRAGYTYLDARVLQSFASDAVAAEQGTPTENPNLPGIAIGAQGPLVGARPFRQAPNTGYFTAQYIRPRLAFSMSGAIASRSDDSTFLEGEDQNYGNTLLLPNRDLDFGYVKLDMGMTYELKHGVTYYVRFSNLFNDQRIGPIGYPGLPLTFQTGLRIRLGGDS